MFFGIVFGLFMVLLLGPALWLPSLLQWRMRTQSRRVRRLAALIGESGARWLHIGLGVLISLIGIAYIASGVTSKIRRATRNRPDGSAQAQIAPRSAIPVVSATRVFSDIDEGAYGLVFSPDGTQLMTAGRSFQLWDLDTGAPQAGLDARDRGVRLVQELTSSADRRFVAVAFGNGTITIDHGAVGRIDWEAPLQCEIHTVPYSPDSVAISADGRYALAAPQFYQERSNFAGFCLVDFEQGEVQEITKLDDVVHVRFIADTYQAVLARTKGRMAVYDAAAGAVVKEIPPPQIQRIGTCRGLAVSPDGRFAVTCYANKGDDNNRLWDLQQGVYVERKTDEGTGARIAFLPDGSSYAIGRFSVSTVDAFDRLTGERTWTFTDSSKGNPANIYALAISPDGHTVAATTQGRCIVWDRTVITYTTDGVSSCFSMGKCSTLRSAECPGPMER